MEKILSEILKIDKDQLNSIDLNRYEKLTSSIDTPKTWFYMESGIEHYRLLAFISTLFQNSHFLDIGTFQGSSSIAMSYNSKNSVTSFDVSQQPEISKINIPNIKYKIGNILEFSDLILNSPFILLDTYHDGSFESQFMKKLTDLNYKGIVLFDDIHLEGAMTTFWNSISIEKYDLTYKGHHSGTGLVYFK
jgi:hypothetical protein